MNRLFTFIELTDSMYKLHMVSVEYIYLLAFTYHISGTPLVVFYEGFKHTSSIRTFCQGDLSKIVSLYLLLYTYKIHL